MIESLNPTVPSEHPLSNSCCFVLVPQAVVLVSPEGKADFGSGHAVGPTPARQAEYAAGGTSLLRFQGGVEDLTSFHGQKLA